MYQPPLFKEDRPEVLHALMRQHPFGLLISQGAAGIEANGLPFLFDPDQGRLLAHLARANGQWQGLQGQEVLVVFQGPMAYVSPSHYETKRDTGKVVPTWNYVMVQARGKARVHEDAAWLKAQVTALTNRHEAAQAQPWSVDDAPASYIDSQLKGIVGVEIAVVELSGKWKVSQNRPEADRRGVAAGLAEANPAMVRLVRDFGGL